MAQMEVSYSRRLDYQYMMIETGGEARSDYRLSMLINNRINGFLPVHPTSQHTDTLRNNKSVAAGSKKHKIRKIHLACVIILLHHPVWHSGCSSDDLKLLKALLTLHFFLAPHNLDLCENDFHLM